VCLRHVAALLVAHFMTYLALLVLLVSEGYSVRLISTAVLMIVPQIDGGQMEILRSTVIRKSRTQAETCGK
jgi:hypothetical protein